ncbi:MAG TPA: LysR family transcriptional regulator [Dehalococcoidia bacterium]
MRTRPDSEAAPLNVHLQQLTYLREVARLGSVTRAAEALHLSQPALSQALAELERRLDVRLFERAGRGRRLTQAGEEVLAFAQRVLAEAEELQGRLERQRRGEGGVLRVGMIDAASLYLLPQVVRRYRAAFPGVQLELAVDASDELLRRLRAHELDLAVLVGPAEEDVEAIELAREPLYVYAPAGDARSMAEAEWVLYPETSRTRRIIEAAFAQRGVSPRVTLESGNPAVLRQMVVMGLGWSVLPPAVVEQGGTASAGLRQGELLTERPLVAARRRGAPDDPRADAFVRLALAQEAAGG